MKLQSEFSREFFKTIFASLPPLASAALPSIRLGLQYQASNVTKWNEHDDNSVCYKPYSDIYYN